MVLFSHLKLKSPLDTWLRQGTSERYDSPRVFEIRVPIQRRLDFKDWAIFGENCGLEVVQEYKFGEVVS